jgi:cell surface hyaluronidase
MSQNSARLRLLKSQPIPVLLCLVAASFGAAKAQTISNASFETPTLATNTFAYRPTGSGWTMTNGTGIARNGSGFVNTNPNAPLGSQVLFMQGSSCTAERLVTISTAGSYRIRLKAAQRTGNQQSFRVLLGGTLVDVITPSNKNYVEYVTSDATLAVGDRMLRIESTNPLGGDNTVLIDSLSIEKYTNGPENWSNPATWGGTVPAAGAHVDIPAGQIVVLDQDIVADSIIVRGTLRFARKTLNVTACSIIADGPTARIEMGTEQSLYTNNLTITLTGGVCTSPTACTCDGTGHEMTDGNVISSINGGVLDIHGANTVSWTKLAASTQADPLRLTLSQAVTWPIGAEILITSTSTNYNESETRTIASITPDGLTITLNSALTYNHNGTQQTYTRSSDGRSWIIDQRAEVGLLSRNIKIQGAADTIIPGHVNEGFGGHVMIMKSGSTLAGDAAFVQGGRGYVEGAEFFRMGRISVKGKYPLHFHMLGEEGKGQYFRNNSIHRSYNRAIVIHGTESSLVERNVAYDHIGHGVMLEDGSERFNRILSNVMALTRRPASLAAAVTPSDFTGQVVQRQSPASYWITNPNNIVNDNIAAGTQGTGLWLLFPRFTVGVSATDPRFSAMNPSLEPLGSMRGNICHSSRTGLDVSDGLTADHDIDSNLGTQYPTGIVVENTTLYANYTGIYTGLTDGSDPSLTTFRGFKMSDNAHHLMMAQNCLVDDVIAVADSGLGLFKFAADGVSPGIIRKAFHRSYDGPARVNNAYFVGFDAADASLFSNNGASFKHTCAPFSQISFSHSTPPRASLHNYSDRAGGNGPQHYDNPRTWMMALLDKDGTLTGLANASVITNNPFMRTPLDFQPANWSNTIRSPYKFAYTTLQAAASYGPYPDMTVTRERVGEPSVSMYYSHLFDIQVELPLIVNTDYVYTYQLHTPTGTFLQYGIGDVAAGDFVRLRFKDVGKLPGLGFRLTNPGSTTITPSAAISKSALDSATVTSTFTDTSTGDVWVKLFNQATVAHTRTILQIIWTGSQPANTVTAVDTDGDGVTDYQEALGSTGDYITGVRDPMVTNDMKFTFDTLGNLEGWVATGVSPAASVTGGELVATSTANDPYFTKTGFNFKGSDIPGIYVRYRSDTSGTLQLFWSNETGGINSTRSISASASYTANSGYKIAFFNLASHPEWAGKTIKSLRLDTLGVAGKITWVDWIKVSLGNTDSDGDGNLDANELATGNDPENASDLRFEFNVDNDFQGWARTNITTAASVTGGSLLATSTNNDPQLARTGFNFSGSAVTSITVRYQADIGGSLQLYWANENGSYSAARLVTASPVYIANAGYKIATFDLSTHAEWVGKSIKALRLDTLAGANKFTQIDYIRGNGATAAALPGQNLIAPTGQQLTADGLLKPSISAMQKISSGGTRLGLSIDAQAGITYRLMASPDLSEGSWRLVNTYTATTAGRVEIQDETSATQQFYRIEFEEPVSN